MAKIELRLLDQTLIDDERLRPSPATAGSAAVDLRACIPEDLQLSPGDSKIISAGIAIHIVDPGLCGVIAPRSGLGSKHGIVLANTIGIIDSDYTGEIKLAVLNRGSESYTIKPYDRVCQMMFVPVSPPEFSLVSSFSSSSNRGDAGFGSTGSG